MCHIDRCLSYGVSIVLGSAKACSSRIQSLGIMAIDALFNRMD
jgi:hypothetical protein